MFLDKTCEKKHLIKYIKWSGHCWVIFLHNSFFYFLSNKDSMKKKKKRLIVPQRWATPFASVASLWHSWLGRSPGVNWGRQTRGQVVLSRPTPHSLISAFYVGATTNNLVNVNHDHTVYAVPWRRYGRREINEINKGRNWREEWNSLSLGTTAV